MVRFIVSIVLMLVVMAGIITIEGGILLTYLGISSFTIMVFVPFFASLAIWKLKDLNQVWKDAFSRELKTSTLRTSLKILDFYERLYYLTGLICMILGFVLVLSKIEDITKLGKGLAYSLNGILYALFFAAVTRILKTRVTNKME